MGEMGFRLREVWTGASIGTWQRQGRGAARTIAMLVVERESAPAYAIPTEVPCAPAKQPRQSVRRALNERPPEEE